jgi:hypothetical protein
MGDELEFDSRNGQEIFVFAVSRLALALAQSPIKWVLGALSPGVKRQGRDNDHSPPSSAEGKNGGAITPLPSTASWLRA